MLTIGILHLQNKECDAKKISIIIIIVDTVVIQSTAEASCQTQFSSFSGWCDCRHVSRERKGDIPQEFGKQHL